MQPVIQTFPPSDSAFETCVMRLAEDASTPRDLQTSVRAEYPNVVVNNGVTDDQGRPRWYVYRDGSWAKTR
jgi:hypothetical protein